MGNYSLKFGNVKYFITDFISERLGAGGGWDVKNSHLIFGKFVPLFFKFRLLLFKNLIPSFTNNIIFAKWNLENSNNK